jgi:hypothetical protein
MAQELTLGWLHNTRVTFAVMNAPQSSSDSGNYMHHVL